MLWRFLLQQNFRPIEQKLKKGFEDFFAYYDNVTTLNGICIILWYYLNLIIFYWSLFVHVSFDLGHGFWKHSLWSRGDGQRGSSLYSLYIRKYREAERCAAHTSWLFVVCHADTWGISCFLSLKSFFDSLLLYWSLVSTVTYGEITWNNIWEWFVRSFVLFAVIFFHWI